MTLRTLNIVLVGMVVVFVALTLLIYCIKLYSAIISRFSNKGDSANKNNKKTEKEKTSEVTETTNVSFSSTTDGITPELIAVITAAIAASIGGSNAGFRVRTIKRTGYTTPVWNVAGRNEYILSRL